MLERNSMYCGGSDKSQSHHHLATSSHFNPSNNLYDGWRITYANKGSPQGTKARRRTSAPEYCDICWQMVHILCKHLLCTWPQMYILIQSCEPLNCQMQLSQILYYCCSRMIHFASIHAPKILSHTRRTFWMHSYHPTSSKSIWDWANNLAKQKYAAAIC